MGTGSGMEWSFRFRMSQTIALVEKEYASTKAEIEEKIKRAKSKALSELKL